MRIFDDQGALLWNGPGNNLVGAELQHAKLNAARLLGIDCRFAEMTGASIIAANFTGSRMDEIVLRVATAGGAIFDGCSLRKALFVGSSLVGASFRGAVLDGADFRSCDVRAVDFDLAASTKGAKFDRVLIDLIEAGPQDGDVPNFTPVTGTDGPLMEDDDTAFLRSLSTKDRRGLEEFYRENNLRPIGTKSRRAR
jgi:hypothetical protein